MSTAELYIQISLLPDNLKNEVADFIAFLNQRNKPQEKKERKFGAFKGQINISPEFDEPLADFKDYV